MANSSVTTNAAGSEPEIPSRSPFRRLERVGQEIVRSILTAKGLVAFALITLGVAVTKFNAATRVVHPLVRSQIHRGGLRLLPMSEIGIAEVKVTTAGYAPEFGQTMGLVYNAITPSGTNTLRGSASYRFRRKDFSAFPYPFVGPKTDERKPDTKIDTWTAEAGGPIVVNKVHFFGGFESTYRDLSGATPVTIRPDDAQRLGGGPEHTIERLGPANDIDHGPRQGRIPLLHLDDYADVRKTPEDLFQGRHPDVLTAKRVCTGGGEVVAGVHARELIRRPAADCASGVGRSLQRRVVKQEQASVVAGAHVHFNGGCAGFDGAAD